MLVNMQVQTSESRPITVSWIIEERLCLCFCPGKRHTRGSVRLERDLDADLSRLKEHYNIQVLVCLLNDAELRSYSLRNYSQSVASHGLEYVQFPIIECAAPHDPPATCALIEDLAQRVVKGQRLAVHCRGGVGRAGMIAACVLLRLSYVATPQAAISEVRRLRCKTAVETRRQEEFVAFYSRHLGDARQAAAGQALGEGDDRTSTG